MGNKPAWKMDVKMELLLPFYSHYTRQPALASIPVKNWRIFLQQSFTARMPLILITKNVKILTVVLLLRADN